MCQAQGEALNSDRRGGGAEHAQDRGLKGTHSLGGQDLAAWSCQAWVSAGSFRKTPPGPS